ncbi:MAG: alpha/beta hydrolase [Saprospiraceae bacterium]
MYYLLLFLILIYILASSLLYYLQEKSIFYPTTLPQDYEFNEFENAEEVFLPISEDVQLHALHFKVPNPKGLILYFHGNTNGLEGWGYMAEPFIKLGYNVFMPDYRGFGKSKGKLGRNVLHKDADQWYDHVSKLYDPKGIVFYGRSLGSGVACSLATRHIPRLLLLETPFYSILSLAEASRPFLPVRWLLKYPMRSDLNIQKVNCPVHLFHGTADAYVPYEQAVKLAEAYGDKSILHTYEGGTHGNLNTFPTFQQKVRELLG